MPRNQHTWTSGVSSDSSHHLTKKGRNCLNHTTAAEVVGQHRHPRYTIPGQTFQEETWR